MFLVPYAKKIGEKKFELKIYTLIKGINTSIE
jgi:hypothetical protein